MNPESKSVICTTMHKAGSTVVDHILLEFCSAKGLEIDRISLQAGKVSKPTDQLYVDYQDKMLSHGVYYGVLRLPITDRMPRLKDLKAIVQVRDPRDCLTSAFFSYRASHVPPKDPSKLAAFNKRREKMLAMDINDYVKSEATSYNNRLKKLKRFAEGHSDVLVLKYEDMVLDTQTWLAKLSDFLEQPLTEDLLANLGDNIQFSVADERPDKHKRKVTPGDHKEKLDAATIEELNRKMSEGMSFFDYR